MPKAKNKLKGDLQAFQSILKLVKPKVTHRSLEVSKVELMDIEVSAFIYI